MIDGKPENAPDSVKVREQQKAALLSGDDSLPPTEDMTAAEIDTVTATATAAPAPTSKDWDWPQSPAPPNNDPLGMFAEVLAQFGDHREVRVHTPIGVISLRALHVCVNQHSVGLILNKNDMHIEPKFGSELTIEIDERPMTVIYGGGLFTFNKIPVTFLSFFRVTEEVPVEEPL